MKRSDIDTRMVLMACHISSNGGKLPPFDMLTKKYNAPWKVVLRAMERDEEKGYLDYGTSIRTAWLTEKGKAKLQKYAHQAASDKVDSLPLKKWADSAEAKDEKLRVDFKSNIGSKVISDVNKAYINGRRIGNLPD